VGVKLGNTPLKISTNLAIVDTGTSYILMPQADFVQLTRYLQKENICGMDAYYNLFKCLCRPDSYEEFPDLKIQIDNNVYTLPKESYIIAVNGTCYF